MSKGLISLISIFVYLVATFFVIQVPKSEKGKRIALYVMAFAVIVPLYFTVQFYNSPEFLEAYPNDLRNRLPQQTTTTAGEPECTTRSTTVEELLKESYIDRGFSEEDAQEISELYMQYNIEKNQSIVQCEKEGISSDSETCKALLDNVWDKYSQKIKEIEKKYENKEDQILGEVKNGN